MNVKGTSLLELVLYSVLGALVVLGAVGVMQRTMKGKDTAMVRSDLEGEMDSLAQNIIQTGRQADSCATDTVASQLICFVNFNNPPTSGNPTAIKFVLSGNSVLYQKADYTNLTTWTTASTYRGVIEFTLCDDQRMEGFPTPCPIQPQKISDRHVSNLDHNIDPANMGPLTEITQYNHFFRFFIRGQVAPGGVWNPSLPDLEHFATAQGAFYIRNYPVLTTQPNLVYQWGNRD